MSNRGTADSFSFCIIGKLVYFSGCRLNGLSPWIIPYKLNKIKVYANMRKRIELCCKQDTSREIIRSGSKPKLSIVTQSQDKRVLAKQLSSV